MDYAVVFLPASNQQLSVALHTSMSKTNSTRLSLACTSYARISFPSASPSHFSSIDVRTNQSRSKEIIEDMDDGPDIPDPNHKQANDDSQRKHHDQQRTQDVFLVAAARALPVPRYAAFVSSWTLKSLSNCRVSASQEWCTLIMLVNLLHLATFALMGFLLVVGCML